MKPDWKMLQVLGAEVARLTEHSTKLGYPDYNRLMMQGRAATGPDHEHLLEFIGNYKPV